MDGGGLQVKYRKKPVVIDAFKWTPGTCFPSPAFDLLHPIALIEGDNSDYLVIKTLEGDMRANNGDFIIRGVKGEFYPCKPDIFDATYEAAE